MGAAPTCCSLLLETRFCFIFLARDSVLSSPSRCSEIAQQHRNIGISSFLLKNLWENITEGLFFFVYFFLKGERENELQAKKREQVTNEKNKV